MPVKRKVPNNHGIFFITFTCRQWLPLIDITTGYDLVYKWFEYLETNGHYIIGYVIMPNHLHVLIGFRSTGKDINTIIGNGKRFMAYGIAARLRQQNNVLILDQLKDGVNKSDRQRGKLHEVWEDSFDWKECNSRIMMEQKLRYIHENPCRGKWHLAESPVDYLHSSAKFYMAGEQGIYTVTNFMEMEDIDLSKSCSNPGESRTLL